MLLINWPAFRGAGTNVTCLAVRIPTQAPTKFWSGTHNVVNFNGPKLRAVCRDIFLFKLFSFFHGNMCVDKFIMLFTQAANFHIWHDGYATKEPYQSSIYCFAFSNKNTVDAPNYNAKTMLGHPSLAF